MPMSTLLPKDASAVPAAAEGSPEQLDADARTLAQLATIAGIARDPADTDSPDGGRFDRRLVETSKLAAIGELTAGAAHEVNNPLFAILGLVEFLLNDAVPGTKSHDRLLLIQSSAGEIRDIVRALLEFSRESPEEHAVVALDDVIRETVRLVHLTTAGHGIEIVEQLSGGPYLVEANANQLKQILLHLLGHARRAMPDGGTATISVGGGASFVEVVLRSTGRSADVPPADLSVSVSIAESHGGSLTASSESGSGEEFTLTLPRYGA
jgi:two-component system NtrC family sensor kinase